MVQCSREVAPLDTTSSLLLKDYDPHGDRTVLVSFIAAAIDFKSQLAKFSESDLRLPSNNLKSSACSKPWHIKRQNSSNFYSYYYYLVSGKKTETVESYVHVENELRKDCVGPSHEKKIEHI